MKKRILNTAYFLFIFLLATSITQSFAKTEFTIYLEENGKGIICDFLEFSEKQIKCQEGKIAMMYPISQLKKLTVINNGKTYKIDSIPEERIPDLKMVVNNISQKKRQQVAAAKQRTIMEDRQLAEENLDKFTNCVEFRNYCENQKREIAGNYYIGGCGELSKLCYDAMRNRDFYEFMKKSNFYLSAALEFAKCDQKMTSAPGCTRKIAYQSRECAASVKKCRTDFYQTINYTPSR